MSNPATFDPVIGQSLLHLIVFRSSANSTFQGLGVTADLNPNNGLIVNFECYEPIPVDTTPSTAGFSGTATRVIRSIKSYALNLYRLWIPTSKQTMLFKEDGTDFDKSVHFPLVRDWARRTYETVRIEGLDSSTNNFFAGSATSLSTVANAVTEDDLEEVVQSMLDNNIEPIQERSMGSMTDGTQPVDSGYYLKAPARFLKSVKRVASWRARTTYDSNAQGDLAFQEKGLVQDGNLRVIQNNLIPVMKGKGSTTVPNGIASTGGQVNVIKAIIIGKDAFVETEFDHKDLSKIESRKPSKTASDEFGDTGSITAEFYYKTRILDENRVARLFTGELE